MRCAHCRSNCDHMIQGCEHCLVSPQIPEELLRKIIVLCHPDKHADSEMANEVTRYLLNLRSHFEPRTYREAELLANGFHYVSHGRCRNCGVEFVWYQTPKGKMIPLDMANLLPHWESCTYGGDFNAKKGKQP